MGWANRITMFRIALAPVFALLFSSIADFPAARDALLVTLWVVFVLSEGSDVLDGWLARRLGETSDLGKVLDPFSDVISRLTIFVCFLLVGTLPLWFFLIVLYRELSMTFLRLLLVRKGVVQAASSGGKAKAVTYFLVSLVCLVQFTYPVTDPTLMTVQFVAIQSLLVIAAVMSLTSFWNYFQIYRKAP